MTLTLKQIHALIEQRVVANCDGRTSEWRAYQAACEAIRVARDDDQRGRAEFARNRVVAGMTGLTLAEVADAMGGPASDPALGDPRVQRLLAAAAAVLEARADQMLTRVEWRELRDALVGCGGPLAADSPPLDDVATDLSDDEEVDDG